MRLNATTRMLLALLLGVAAGLLLGRTSAGAAQAIAAVLKPLGQLWINALQMTVVPLVFSLVVLGVGHAQRAAASGRVARRTLLVFALLLGFSALVAAVAAPPMFARLRLPAGVLASLNETVAAPAKTANPADWLLAIVPSNAIAAAAQGAMLPLVVFALALGFALTRIAAERAARVQELLAAIADAMSEIVRWVLLLAPLGVFALVFALVATTGLGTLAALAGYLGVLCVLYLAVTLGMYGVVAVAGRDRLDVFLRAALPAQVVAMSTQSSLASLPAMLDATRGRLRHPGHVPALVLPMAVSLFRLTSPVQYLVVAAFIAAATGHPVTGMQWLTMVPLAVVVSLGSVGLPGQAIFLATNLPVVQALGLPMAPLGVLMAMDAIPDVLATLGNVTADMAATSVVARGEAETESRQPEV